MAAYNTNTLASLYRKARGIGENALSMLTSGFASLRPDMLLLLRRRLVMTQRERETPSGKE